MSFHRKVAIIFFIFIFCRGRKSDSVKLHPRKSPHGPPLWDLGSAHSLCPVSRDISWGVQEVVPAFSLVGVPVDNCFVKWMMTCLKGIFSQKRASCPCMWTWTCEQSWLPSIITLLSLLPGISNRLLIPDTPTSLTLGQNPYLLSRVSSCHRPSDPPWVSPGFCHLHSISPVKWTCHCSAHWS